MPIQAQRPAYDYGLALLGQQQQPRTFAEGLGTPIIGALLAKKGMEQQAARDKAMVDAYANILTQQDPSAAVAQSGNSDLIAALAPELMRQRMAANQPITPYQQAQLDRQDQSALDATTRDVEAATERSLARGDAANERVNQRNFQREIQTGQQQFQADQAALNRQNAQAVAGINSQGSGNESWGQPVTEAGADGKPIVVRYSNRKGRQVVEAATPAPRVRAPAAKIINDLTAAGTNVANLTRLGDTFQDRYGGNIILGDMANKIGRTFGDETGQSQWWQDYQAYINEVRNKLFGSALTPQERTEFEKAVVTPRMNSGEIKKNLARQVELAKAGALRLANPYLSGGYDREMIEGALGMGIDDLNAPPAATPAAAGALSPEEQRELEQLRARFGRR